MNYLKNKRTIFKTLFVFSFIIVSLNAYSQRKISLRGLVIDDRTEQPIANVNIIEMKSRYGATTAENGEFTISSKTLPANIQLSHVSYQSREVSIESSEKIIIRLKKKSHELGPVTVQSDPVINIVEDKPFYIWDYEFYGEDIIFLAYHDMSMFKPRLVLFNVDGDSIASVPVKKARKLFKDCTDKVHLITKDEVSQIYYDSTELQLVYTYPVAMLDSILDPCIEKMGENYYYHQYYYRNQILLYYYFNLESEETVSLTTIEDSLRMLHALDEERFASMGSYDEFDKRFVEMVIYAPIYAPLRKIGKEIYVFNFTNDLIMIFNEEGEELRSVSINFHHEKSWKKDILVDEERGKVYTVFSEDGLFRLNEINLITGKLGPTVLIPSYPFIEKIKIRDGFVYFLYKEKKHYQYKKLFKMPL